MLGIWLFVEHGEAVSRWRFCTSAANAEELEKQLQWCNRNSKSGIKEVEELRKTTF